MARRMIKEGEPMDPIQVGDIITLDLKNGQTISELLAVEPWSSNCKDCAMSCTGVECYDGWEVKDPEKYGKDFKSMALCCTKPVLDSKSKELAEFCKFIQLDTILENL